MWFGCAEVLSLGSAAVCGCPCNLGGKREGGGRGGRKKCAVNLYWRVRVVFAVNGQS